MCFFKKRLCCHGKGKSIFGLLPLLFLEIQAAKVVTGLKKIRPLRHGARKSSDRLLSLPQGSQCTTQIVKRGGEFRLDRERRPIGSYRFFKMALSLQRIAKA